MRRAAAFLAVAAAAFLASCGPDTITLPTPPMAMETQQLVALYDMPTATLDTSNIDQVRADAQARLDELNVDWLPNVVSDALARLRARLAAGSLPTDPASQPKARRAQVTAVVEVQRICVGWDNPPSAPDQATNGSIDLTAIVDTGKIKPEAWATASSCRVRFPPADNNGAIVVMPSVVQATLDGTLIIYLLAPLPSDPADASFLLSFSGSISRGDQMKSASFDFQVVDKSVRFRVPAGGGDAIVTVGTTLGIQGANAGFSCDLTTLTCQKSSGPAARASSSRVLGGHGPGRDQPRARGAAFGLWLRGSRLRGREQKRELDAKLPAGDRPAVVGSDVAVAGARWAAARGNQPIARKRRGFPALAYSQPADEYAKSVKKPQRPRSSQSYGAAV